VRLNAGQIEVMDDQMAEICRQMTGAQRLAVANDMFESARRMLLIHLRATHPEWSDEQILREAARRLSHGAITL
jgi:hypothetical protein